MAIESGFTAKGLPYSRFGKGGPKLLIISSIWDVLFSADQRPRVAGWVFRRFGKHFDCYLLGRQRKLPLGYTTRQMAEDAAAAMREFGGAPFSVMGLSLGSNIAQYLAADHPELVQAVVLAAAGARHVPHAHQAARTGLVPAAGKPGPGFDDVIELSFTGFTKICFGILAKVVRARNMNRADFIVSTLAAINHDSRERLAEIRCPVLVAGGKQDIIVPEDYFRELADSIPGASLFLIDSGHGVFVDKKRPFERATLEFLREHAAAGAGTRTTETLAAPHRRHRIGSGMGAHGGKFENGVPYARFGRGPRKLVILNSIMDVVRPVNTYPRIASLFYLAFRRDFEVWLVGRPRGLPLGCTIRDMARGAAAGIREIGEPVHIVGLSMGSFLVQELAAEHPELVRSAILVSTGARANLQEDGRASLPGSGASNGDLVPDLSALVDGSFTGAKRLFYGLLLKLFVNKRWSRGDYIVSTLAWMKHDARERLGLIQAPALVLAGRDDKLVTREHFEELAAGLPNARLKLMPGGHSHYMDNRLAFAAEVARFVKGLEDRSSSPGHGRSLAYA